MLNLAVPLGGLLLALGRVGVELAAELLEGELEAVERGRGGFVLLRSFCPRRRRLLRSALSPPSGVGETVLENEKMKATRRRCA